MQCPKCGTQNPEEAKFCSSCGTRLDGKVACPSCGHECDSEAYFCPSCGKQLRKKETPAPQKAKKDGKAIKDKLSKIFTLILSIGSIAFFALANLLMFGDYFTTTDGTVYSFFSLISLLWSSKNPYTTSSVQGQLYDISLLTTSITMMVLLIGYAAVMITLSIKGVIKEAKNLKNKEPSDSDKLLIGELLLTYLVKSVVVSYASPASTTGVCISLILVFGMILLILKLAYRFVFTFQRNMGRCFASYICLAMVLLHSMGLLGGMADSYLTIYRDELLISDGFIYSFNDVLYRMGVIHNSGWLSTGDINGVVLIANITTAISLVCMILSYVFSYKIAARLFDNNQNSNKKTIVYSSLLLGLTVINCLSNAVLALTADSKLGPSSYHFMIGASSISSIDLALIMLGGTIASYQLRKSATETYSL